MDQLGYKESLFVGNALIEGTRDDPMEGTLVTVGSMLGCEDNIPLALGLLFGTVVGLPVFEGLKLGCEVGGIEALGVTVREDDGGLVLDGNSDGIEVGQ